MASRTKRTKSKAQGAAGDNGGIKNVAGLGSKLVGSLPAKTALSRLSGVRPSRTRAFFAATAAAFTGGVLVYRALRSGGDD